MSQHPIAHFEIYGRDRETLAAFYRDTFGWGVNSIPQMQFESVTVAEDGLTGGGILDADGDFQGTIVYVSCPDIDASVERAVANGAEVLKPVQTFPGIVTYAILRDPQGNRFGLVAEVVPEAAD